jgi:hypothetical protein
MRFAIIGGALAAALLVGLSSQASAQYRRVCAIYHDGSMLCYYDNFRQCRQAIFGLGRASCILNPGYDPYLDRRSR